MHIKTSNQPKVNMGFGNYTCNWGLHICGLYETEEERDQLVFGFLEKGYSEGDLQFYVPTERTFEDFKVKFTANCPHCESDLENTDKFQIMSGKELYYPTGKFSPKAMDDGLNDFFASSQKNGKRNIRATAEMAWALEAIPGVEHLMVYESRLNYFIPGKPWISMCLYNVTKFDGATIMNVLRTHPYSINRGIVVQNPFYQDPDIWLSENAPEFLNM
ncbi:MAG: MEDS domain-containing protein [Salinivirgaceae bacterium]|jgi:hypothetical protein|nr:MEDS domain-containing protein [Salinivirgaceae bacterium]